VVAIRSREIEPQKKKKEGRLREKKRAGLWQGKKDRLPGNVTGSEENESGSGRPGKLRAVRERGRPPPLALKGKRGARKNGLGSRSRLEEKGRDRKNSPGSEEE